MAEDQTNAHELPESSTWEPTIYCIQTTDYVAGGVNGVSNRQAKQLANRTTYLKSTLEQQIEKELEDQSALNARINASDTAAANAQTTADTAFTTATNAQNTANTAEEDAQTGISNAAKAQTRADNAYELATTATKTANQAISNSQYASEVANNALQNANTAQATADARLPLSGGTLTGTVTNEYGKDNTTGATSIHFQGRMGDTDYWRIAAGAEGPNYGYVEFSTAITGNEPIYVRQYAGEHAGEFSTVVHEAVLLDRMGNTKFPGIIEADGFIGKATSSTTAGTAEKLGSIDVGSETNPMYLAAGKPTACSETVGNSTSPVYISNGKFTQCTGNVGSGSHPVYLSEGTITQSSQTIGSDSIPMHLSGGKFTPATSNIGTEKSPLYMDGGVLKPLSATVGSSTSPVFLSNGVIKACGGDWSKITSSSIGASSTYAGPDYMYIQYSSGLCFQSITISLGSIRLSEYANILQPCSYKKEVTRYLTGFCVLSTPSGAAPVFTSSAILNASGTSCQVWIQNPKNLTVTNEINATFVIWGMV